MRYPKRVLLIDDDEDDCYIFNSAVIDFDCGIEFFYECDSERALRCLTDGLFPVPDLLLLDWNMPRVTGSQFLQAIRSIPLFTALPIIIYTTSTAQRDRDEARLLGASYFVSKPSTQEELQKLLRHIFSMQWE
jgi:CheY-like chemotaxis protein